MLWTSIATGKRPEKHGIHGFVEPNPTGGGLRVVSSTSRRCKALWNILTQKGISSNVVGWFASQPAEPIKGAIVSNLFNQCNTGRGQPWPLRPFSVHPPRLESALAELRVHPGELEQPHLQPFVPKIAEVDQSKDRSIATIAKLLAECATTHAAATWLMEHEPADFTAVFYDAIDHFCHGFMSSHPPRMPNVSEKEFELYKDVVTGCYKYHDMMLHRLLELAGDDTTVIIISDHGFRSDASRPTQTPDFAAGPTIWHRPYGIVCMKGPGIKRAETIYGASILDITPTILTLMGLPVGADMDGRPLLQAFDPPVAPDQVFSWENIGGECGMHPPDWSESPEEAAAAIQHLVGLGYIDPPDAKGQAQAEWALRENRFNLGCALIDAGRTEEAAATFEKLHAERPDEVRFTGYLLRCRYVLGDLDACRALAGPFMEKHRETPMGHLLSGALALSEGRADDAIGHLLAGEKIQNGMPELHQMLGRAYMKLERWSDAERAYRRALDIDGDSARAYDGLATALLRQDRDQDAADASLTAVSLQHHLPSAHFHLGVALARLQRPVEAITAFEQCLVMKPDSPLVHQWLARVYEHSLNDHQRATHHADKARELANRETLRRGAAKAFTPSAADAGLGPVG
jgi:tetratricopeptide (TPR) repeat protein